jgi:hypothetical protein
LHPAREEVRVEGWIITWERVGHHPEWPDERPRTRLLSAEVDETRIAWLLRLLYTWESMTDEEQLLYLDKPEEAPYQPVLEKGLVVCGHNPFLEARRVRNLRVEATPDGNVLRWDDRRPGEDN